MKYANAEWQMLSGDDEWAFGVKVRGVVRERLAEVYFDEERLGPDGGWVWMAHATFNPETGGMARGVSPNLTAALEECERALGLFEQRDAMKGFGE